MLPAIFSLWPQQAGHATNRFIANLINVVIYRDTALQVTLQTTREHFVGNCQSGGELETIRDTRNALR
jgi:hypothetical protein